MSERKLEYALGRVTDVVVEIEKTAFQGDLDKNKQAINFISAIGRSKRERIYTKVEPLRDADGNLTGEVGPVEKTARPEITLCVDKRVNPLVFEQLKNAKKGAVCEVEGELSSKNFPETKNGPDGKPGKQYDRFAGMLHVTSIKVTQPS